MESQQARTLAGRLMENMSQAVVGKSEAVRLVVTALIGGGHVLLEDVPGVGKTLLAKSVARSISATFRRVQFTSDLLPSDITGVSIYNPQASHFDFVQGPIFANILLGDEINRSSPRTQSSLLEAMEELQVSVDGEARMLPDPFFVIATQNPVEFHGTFPLPESQMDRFMISLSMGYPSLEDEVKMLRRQEGQQTLIDRLEPVLSLDDIVQLRRAARDVHVSEEIDRYIVRLARATREDEKVTLGISPRGSVALFHMAQGYALVEGRDFVTPDDVKAVAPYVLTHRLLLRHSATRQQLEQFCRDLINRVAIN